LKAGTMAPLVPATTAAIADDHDVMRGQSRDHLKRHLDGKYIPICYFLL
jgi:hypothetical protein